jgi:tropomyosin-1
MQAETEVAATAKRIMQMEEDYDATETKLAQTTTKLAEATKAADDSERSDSIIIIIIII